MQFRTCTGADIALVLRFFKQSSQRDPKKGTAEALQERISRFPDSILICVQDGEVIGIAFTREDEWGTFISRLFVRKDWRKQGIGRLLVRYAESFSYVKNRSEFSKFVLDIRDLLTDFYISEWRRFGPPGSYCPTGQ